MTERTSNESHEWSGEWWRPEKPDQKVSGVLSFNPESGLRLRLIGGWDYHVTHPGNNGSTIITDKMQHWPMVLGSGDGKGISLINVSVVSAKSFGFGGLFGPPDKLELRAATALVGVHMERPEEAAFTAASAHIEDMTLWSRRSGVEEIHHWSSEPDAVSGEVKLSRLSPRSATAGPLSVRLSRASWQPFSESSRSQTITRVRENELVRFEREEAQPLEYWTDLLNSMADLMSLSTLRPCGILSMNIYFPSKSGDWPAGHAMQGKPHEVKIYQKRITKPKPDEPALEIRSYILTLEDMPFEDLLPRWLAVRDKFAAARSMVLGLRYVQSGYVETRVVTAVAAAESMHRALDPEPPLPPEEFKNIRKKLLETVQPERKSWLADRLTDHSNVPTLKQRLHDLVDRVGVAGMSLVHDANVWAKAAKDARNNLAHLGNSEEDLEHLHAVAEVTAGIVVLNLLHELGVPQDRLQLAVQENPVLSHAERMAREVLCKDQSITIRIAAINAKVVRDSDLPAASTYNSSDS